MTLDAHRQQRCAAQEPAGRGVIEPRSELGQPERREQVAAVPLRLVYTWGSKRAVFLPALLARGRHDLATLPRTSHR